MGSFIRKTHVETESKSLGRISGFVDYCKRPSPACNSVVPASLRRESPTLIFEIVSRVRIRDFNGAEDISISAGLKFIRRN